MIKRLTIAADGLWQSSALSLQYNKSQYNYSCMPMIRTYNFCGDQLFWIAYSNRITSETRLNQDKLNHIILSSRGDMYGENVLLNASTQPFL
jgi:hypothetical protein